MFVQQKSEYPLGIIPHRTISYVWESALLRGTAFIAEDGSTGYNIASEPHLARLQSMDRTRLTHAFNQARNTTIYIGEYDSLDAAASYIDTLESHFRTVLADRGAVQRILRDGALHETNNKTESTFGNALRRARQEEIFGALRAGQPVAFNQIAGRILRPLALALNASFTEEIERYDDKARTLHSVTYTFDKLASFTFIDNGADDYPTIIRNSYDENANRYRQTYSGPASLDNMKRHIFQWLADAAQEQQTPDEDVQIIQDLSAKDRDRFSQLRVPPRIVREIRRGNVDLCSTQIIKPRPDAVRALLEDITGPQKPEPQRPSFMRLVK
ncbi:MAG: hypothetical protein KKA05_01455 [Alphaproteobacteria bacterium]|nr:hypothetical protein [Alphaproteobacteria bacterium]